MKPLNPNGKESIITMNYFIDAQITNMIAITKTFEEACQLAALRDDGKISEREAVGLQAIRNASERFRSELEQAKQSIQ